MEISDHLAAINLLCYSVQQGVPALQGLRQCWSYVCLLLNSIGNNAHGKMRKSSKFSAVNSILIIFDVEKKTFYSLRAQKGTFSASACLLRLFEISSEI